MLLAPAARRARRVVALALAAIACVTTACGNRDVGSPQDAIMSRSRAVPPPPPQEEALTSVTLAAPAPSAIAAGAASPAADSGGAADAEPSTAPAGSPGASASSAAGATDTAASSAAAAMLIRTGTASVQVDSVEQAITRLRELAARLGGYVANASLAGGTDQVRSATLEIKVPSARFDALTSGLRPLGHVETVDVKAQDVGEEYVDVAAQLANGRRLETRLVALAERQSNRLADLLSVERELARVRGEIDRAEGRLRYLRAHAATSTLTVTVHARAPIIGDSPSANPVVEAFRQAWRIFVGVVAFLIASLGVLVPLALLGMVALYLRRRVGARFPARRSAPKPAQPNTPIQSREPPV